MAGTFVAVLELARAGALTLAQDRPPSGPIRVRTTRSAEVESPATPAA